MNEELKPCPFCGNSASWCTMAEEGSLIAVVGCDTCPASIDCEGEYALESAVDLWNRRA